MIPLLLAGGAAANIGGSLFGGLFGSSAEKKRAAAIQAAGQQGAAEIAQAGTTANARIQDQLKVARGDLAPFRNAGAEAGVTLADLLMGRKSPSGMLKASDLFNFQSDLGSRNINRELAARGLYGSGAGLETLARFNDQLVGEEGQRLVDRLFNLTGLGANSAGTMAGITGQAGFQQGSNLFNSGVEAANLRYNSTVGAANARANATQMLGQMGQGILGQVGSGLTSYGNYGLQKPFLDQSLAMTNRLLGGGTGGGMTGSQGATGNYMDAYAGWNYPGR